jgi:hypothetical protein
MKNLLTLGLVGLLCSPLFVHAEAYKCRQPDGSLAFQDHPCAAGASGSKVDLPPVQSYSPGSNGMMSGSDDMDESRVDKQRSSTAAANARIEAENRQARCDAARQRLGVLKEERPVYERDNQGNRVYIEDKDRPAAIAEAQREVTANCQ